MHTVVVQVYALAGHAHVGTCTSAIDLVHGFAAQPSVWHFSALVCYKELARFARSLLAPVSKHIMT